MIKVIRNFKQNVPLLSKNIKPQRLLEKQVQYFSDKKQKQDDKKKEQGYSLFQIYQYLKRSSQVYLSKARQIPYAQWLALLTVPFLAWYLSEPESSQYPINYFQNQIRQNGNYYSQLDIKIQIRKQQINYRIQFQKDGAKKFITIYNNPQRFRNILRKISANTKIRYHYQPSYELKLTNVFTMSSIISVIFITAFFIRSSSMGGVKKGGKTSGAKGGIEALLNKKSFQVITHNKVKFDDVAGLDQSKVQVKQFVDFLKNPAKYKKLGARIPKGVLLSGPPGTGKTMLAKACAGQAGVPFIPTSGSDFVQIFVGVGASRVRQLFALAKSKAPSIIFIDQIDAVGRKRSGSHGSHDQRDNTLNQILVQMDGFQTDNNVIVMAATNRQNLLDSALIRPGRFDRLVEINLPDLQGRRQIFNVHLSKINVADTRTKDQYSRRLATLTPGFSGAEIANLCNQAAILAARNNKTNVDSHDLQMATQRIIGGIERKNIISAEQKKLVAVHESGHAVVSWFLQGADPLLKLTIIPRSKGSLGFAQYFVNQTKLNTKQQLIDRICFILGGRCAQQLFFGKVTNGASDDLKKAYQIAHNIVVKLGMNEEIGYIGYKDPQYFRPYSQQMGQKIDAQIMKLIGQCTQRTQMMVRKYQSQIKALSNQLYQKQTLTIRQIRKILGERDFTSNQTYEKYLQIQKELEKDKVEQVKNVSQLDFTHRIIKGNNCK